MRRIPSSPKSFHVIVCNFLQVILHRNSATWIGFWASQTFYFNFSEFGLRSSTCEFLHMVVSSIHCFIWIFFSASNINSLPKICKMLYVTLCPDWYGKKCSLLSPSPSPRLLNPLTPLQSIRATHLSVEWIMRWFVGYFRETDGILTKGNRGKPNKLCHATGQSHWSKKGARSG